MKRYTSKNETGANILELKPDNPTWIVSQGKELNYKISGDAIDKFAEYETLEEKGLLHKAPLPNGTAIYLWQKNDVDEWFVYQDSYLYGVSEYYHGKLGEDFFVSEEECRNHSVS